MDDRKPSYYAVIPADVRYDSRLKPNAKLLYGEISALISADKYRCIIAVYYLFKFFRVVFCCRSFKKIGTA